MPNCPHCGQELEPGNETCSACDQGLTPPAEPEVVPPVAPEQSQITEVKVGDYVKAGWELFKKYPAGFVGYFIITLVTSFALNLVPLIGWLIGFALISPLNAGFFVVGAKLLKNQTPEFADFFGGFKLFVPLALLGVVSSILISIRSHPAYRSWYLSDSQLPFCHHVCGGSEARLLAGHGNQSAGRATRMV